MAMRLNLDGLNRGLRGWLWLPMVLGLAGGGAPRARAAEGDPPRQRAERLHYDEQTGAWIRTPSPIPGTEDGDLDIARQHMAREEYEEALDAVKDWIDAYGPDSPRYPEALYLKSSAHLELKDYRSAHDGYQALLNDFPGSPYAEEALAADFRVAEQYLAGKRRRAWKGLIRVKDRDAGIKILDDIILNYPDTSLAELAQRTKADYYYSRGEFEIAEDEYAAFSREYPRSRFTPYALLQSARAALASFPGVQFDDAGLVEARERFTQFMQLYPVPAQDLDVPVILEEIAARRAEKTLEIGKFYEKTAQFTVTEKERRTSAARYYYRMTTQRWPDTPAAAEASGRLAALGEPVDFGVEDEQMTPPAPADTEQGG